MTNATILSNEMPTTGQFIAVHKFAGDTWARTYRHTVDGVEAYELHATNEWSPIGMPVDEYLSDVEVVGYLGLA
ncbi:hypothetical protein PODOV005v1_10013 [Vibrio phage PS32B.2]|nr:hypothetical protein PODOV005v1_10013 [Vibrio phage PS32B.2]QZI86316.1 hypothetical protein PODOV028v1_10025 [Vibrio phage PS32B.3]QZI86380.1 hypothetical protein PODOV029v1_10027 [Vibrio phage PS35B.1]QZI86439.1 hypothetical protein PODOV027v1_10030 [Vibrio phage PS35B.3]QZI92205.1 hypothetical protein PODOV026v1_p0032 [Vibrio phage PS32B.1]QZI92248.1 hypothetical protein PODOV004v1_p0013 [Vibrio phage PS32B.11]QZI92329.1 hypothetical protein PODOV025v1_p0032 [Vibrio phage PS32B.6]